MGILALRYTHAGPSAQSPILKSNTKLRPIPYCSPYLESNPSISSGDKPLLLWHSLQLLLAEYMGKKALTSLPGKHFSKSSFSQSSPHPTHSVCIFFSTLGPHLVHLKPAYTSTSFSMDHSSIGHCG